MQLLNQAGIRKKIILGGLVIKAELDHLSLDSPSMLYGMLLYCKHLSTTKPELLATWQELGTQLIK
ncbi:MAG: conjugal transfer protein TraD [Rickettsiaceae bacterium]|nr:MAG: conjugal transfer protein TraD [Rickettsiaceae bacterium]